MYYVMLAALDYVHTLEQKNKNSYSCICAYIMPTLAEEVLQSLHARIEKEKKDNVVQIVTEVKTWFRSLRRELCEEMQRLFDVLSAREQARVNEKLERELKDFGNRVTAHVSLDADSVFSPCDKNNLFYASKEVADSNYQSYCAQDQFDRVPLCFV